jgi:hypothetical protein
MDIAQALGTTEPAGTYPIAIFIPSVDREGVPIDQAYWIKEALTVLGRRFGGATAMPPSTGVWRDDEQGGELKSPLLCFAISDAHVILLGPTCSFG